MPVTRNTAGRFAPGAHTEASSTLAHPRLADLDEFVHRRFPQACTTEADVDDVRSRVPEIMRSWESDPEWLPDVERADAADDAFEGDSHITDLSDLTDPEVSAGMCDRVSEAFHGWGEHQGEQYEIVQGMDDPDLFQRCHYANVVISRSGNPVIVDFTFSQFDETAPFPLVCTPRQWSDRLDDWTSRN